MKIFDRVKLHAVEMIKLLQRLVKLSKDDTEMERCRGQFYDECMNNLVIIIGDRQKTLRPKARGEFIVIEPPQLDQIIEQEEAVLAYT